MKRYIVASLILALLALNTSAWIGHNGRSGGGFRGDHRMYNHGFYYPRPCYPYWYGYPIYLGDYTVVSEPVPSEVPPTVYPVSNAVPKGSGSKVESKSDTILGDTVVKSGGTIYRLCGPVKPDSVKPDSIIRDTGKMVSGVINSCKLEGYVKLNGGSVKDTAKTALIDTVVINIPGTKGGYIPVRLKKTKFGYIGPQGEFYIHPTIDQLKALYGN